LRGAFVLEPKDECTIAALAMDLSPANPKIELLMMIGMQLRRLLFMDDSHKGMSALGQQSNSQRADGVCQRRVGRGPPAQAGDVVHRGEQGCAKR
jgi:hypothetical protein